MTENPIDLPGQKFVAGLALCHTCLRRASGAHRLRPTRPIAMMREGWRTRLAWLLQARAHEIAVSHAVRSLIIARKKFVGQRVTPENQLRALAVVFGVRLPRALTEVFIDQALKASERVAGLSAVMRGPEAPPSTASTTALAPVPYCRLRERAKGERSA